MNRVNFGWIFPFPLFEEIVKECKEAHIFTTGKKTPTTCDEFKVLACLRNLGPDDGTMIQRQFVNFLGLRRQQLMTFLSCFLSTILRSFIKSMYKSQMNSD